MKKRKRGFTLIELVVVMALITIFGLAVMALFIGQSENFNYVQSSTNIQKEATVLLESLENDIRVAKNRQFNAHSVTVDSLTYMATTNQKILYKFTEKVTPTDTEQTYAYIYDTSKGTIKKVKLVASGTNVVVEEIATLTESATSKDGLGYPNSIKITNKSAAGATTNFTYDIDLKLVKGKEVLEFNTSVITRN